MKAARSASLFRRLPAQGREIPSPVLMLTRKQETPFHSGKSSEENASKINEGISKASCRELQDSGDSSRTKLHTAAQKFHKDVPATFMVCGFFTPDYEHWFRRLERSLIEHNAPYDFQAVPKMPGGWEANTRRKPRLILDAMYRHHGKTIIWCDVDAICVGDPAQLVGLPCDVAIRLHSWRTRHRVSLMARAGTIVFNPTENARRLADAWAAEADCAQYGDHDEVSLTLAVGAVEGLVLMHLGEIGLKVIQHDNASASVRKIRRWDRRRHWAWSKLPDWITGNWQEPEEDTGLRFPPRKGGEE